MPNNRYEHIIGSNYCLHITPVGPEKTAHEKMLAFIEDKRNNVSLKDKAPEITGKYFGVLYKLGEDGKTWQELPTRTKFWHMTDTLLRTDSQTGCVLLKGAFSGLTDKSRVRFHREEIGSALLIPEIDKVREFTDDTVIHDHGKYTSYTVKIFDDKEENVEKKFKYNFLNVNGQLIRRENFSPVGAGNMPVTQVVRKPFYERDEEAIGRFINDRKLFDDQEDFSVYPPAYVVCGEHTCECYPSPAAFLLANIESDGELISNTAVVEQAYRDRQACLEQIIEATGMAFDAGKISEKTYKALMHQFNYEYAFMEEYEKYLKDNENVMQ